MPSFASDPSSDYVVFDYNVFDWSMAIMDVIPTLNKVIMEREFYIVEQGQAVNIVINIQDIMSTVGARYNFDPDTTPQIEIYNPDGSVAVVLTNMNFLSITGMYGYQHQTDDESQQGAYTARFTAVNGTMTMLTDKIHIFTVTEQ